MSAHLTFRYFWNPLLRDIGNVGYSATPAALENDHKALIARVKKMGSASEENSR